ncbi:uncharacterized protein A1O9_10227 [Exophiala aquamarina CBS 119918]|uniref:Uncharacterized protein n=1 Tax=Exophiala aquamarina CBS 119918 TaxID=1182545 RepID=A0A072P1Y1_9EURO|nr:uncharacterized protein A1O9_10227 [Exophiala aquamarina CBS 119918]KEF53826.1 hypothetical protein A1O9_10227 [Exophiala aquamarina CBS 119918]
MESETKTTRAEGLEVEREEGRRRDPEKKVLAFGALSAFFLSEFTGTGFFYLWRNLDAPAGGVMPTRQGPWLRVYDQGGTQNVNELIFESQPIQGIEVIRENAPQTLSRQFNIVAWGGRWMRYGVLNFGSSADPPALSKPTVIFNPMFDAQDWVLKVAILQDSTRSPSQASVTSTFMLTSHNTLLEVCPKSLVDSSPPSHNVVVKVQGLQSFLYSGDINLVDANYIIIASGTVFGEIIAWTCQRANHSASWVPITRHRYNGHRGSIFGVNISPKLTLNGKLTRLMASCSDDRTIRVWDISNCDQSTALLSCQSLPVLTGFGNIENLEDLQLAATWGHASRIWSVLFDIRQNISGQDEVFLLSRGEDATCRFWSLKVGIDAQANQPFVLQPVMQDRHHSGKNIWSLAQMRIESSMRVYTGGADGQLVLRTIGDGENALLPNSKSFNEITGSGRALRLYTLLTHEECLATTEYGELFLLSTRWGSVTHNWIKILDSSSKMNMITCYLRRRKLVVLARQNGTLAILQLSDHHLIPLSTSLHGAISWIHAVHQPDPAEGLPTCMIACLANNQAFILRLPATSPSEIEVASLTLPETFTITASCYDPATKVLILGSRAGALAFYFGISKSAESAASSSCFRHVHGENCITSIKVLGTMNEAETGTYGAIHILTTGRDGCYAVHCIKRDSAAGVNQPHFSTLHLSSPPFGPNIEGSYFARNDMITGAKSVDLILYGFRSNSFVVWNETQQRTIFSVDCGGSHRSWSYTDSSSQTESETLKTTDQGRVTQEVMRTFVWTKAGNFNWHTLRGSSHKSIVMGGHGREIKAVGGCSRFYKCNSQNLPLVATGAEDTNIHIFALPAGQLKVLGKTAFQSLTVLKGHTAGLQHLSFSPSGRYLFSSAGCEEFYIWKLTFDVPCIDVGVVLQDQLPKEDADSDARIMSFDLKDISDKSPVAALHESAFLVALAYSNGKAKIVHYTPTSKRRQGRFETLREIQYGSFCLMQASFLSGHVRTEPGQFDSYILSGGTNGFLNMSAFNLADVQQGHTPIEVHRVHQSSILSMDTVPLAQGSWLTATGGDDNALGLTIISRAAIPLALNTTAARSLCVPRAHAAALTALKIASVKRTAGGFNVAVISVGNDQRVKIWEVGVSDYFLGHSKDKLLDGFKVKKLGAAWTAVADSSAIEIVREPEEGVLHKHEQQISAPERCRIMIVGVGMELLDVDLRSN